MAQAHVKGLVAGKTFLDVEFWKDRGGSAGWRQMLERETPEVLNHLLRRCSHAERPFGPESFVREFEEKLGRQWKRWPFEQELVDTELRLALERLAAP